MASCKLEQILCVLALVSCVLIGTVAGNEAKNHPKEALEELISRLKNEKLAPIDVETILGEYEGKEDNILDLTVGELVELCRESLDKCSLNEFMLISQRTIIYKVEIPQLYEYGRYCRYKKLANYCLNNIDRVTKNLMDTVSKEDQALVEPFRQMVQNERIPEVAHEIGIALEPRGKVAAKIGQLKTMLEKYTHSLSDDSKSHHKNHPGIRASEIYFRSDAEQAIEGSTKLNKDIYAAYSNYAIEKLGPEASIDQQELFLQKFTRSIKHYWDVHKFLLDLNDGQESGPHLNDEFLADMFKFGKIASRFYNQISPKIYRELQKTIPKDTRKKYGRSWAGFISQTEEEILKNQANRRAELAANPPGKWYWLRDILNDPIEMFM